MNPKLLLTIRQIKAQTSQLINDKQLLINKLQELDESNKNLKQTVALQKNTLETLQTQNKIIKLAEILPQDDAYRQELKQQINTYIKHIDECIRLLSE
ncbi:MAG: hypothetical protein EAY81_08635 [Bacteroidetes bacterium]|nr:MAG: hypothetical protein EAY81_08635 [Bacteroidota bacterium]